MASNNVDANGTTSALQQDWDDREFVEVVHLNMVKIANFLNNFDITVRTKIASLNERLSKLERTVEFCEAMTKSTLDRANREQRAQR